MTKRTQDLKKLDEVIGLADLGVIDEREFERRWEAAGGLVVDVPIEDAPLEHLIDLYSAPSATEAHKAYFASLIVARGFAACGGCDLCQEVEAYAKRWNEQIAKNED